MRCSRHDRFIRFRCAIFGRQCSVLDSRGNGVCCPGMRSGIVKSRCGTGSVLTPSSSDQFHRTSFCVLCPGRTKLASRISLFCHRLRQFRGQGRSHATLFCHLPTTSNAHVVKLTAASSVSRPSVSQTVNASADTHRVDFQQLHESQINNWASAFKLSRNLSNRQF